MSIPKIMSGYELQKTKTAKKHCNEYTKKLSLNYDTD